MKLPASHERLSELLLRIGVAFSFMYPSISAWFSPYSWVGYFPSFIRDIVGSSDILLLHTFGFFELAIAVWILLGKRVVVPASIAAAVLLLIVIFNLGQMDILFRDIPILLMAAILATKGYYQKKV